MVDIILGVIREGLLFSIMALGVYITYKILDFPDLSVDSTFPLGAAVTAMLIVKDVNPYVTLLAALLAGAIAGTVTGIIHVVFKVRDLLSGIIVMTGLYAINLRIAGSANVAIFSKDNIFENKFMDKIIPQSLEKYSYIIEPNITAEVAFTNLMFFNSLVPMITLARPITIVPVPDEISKKPFI